MGTPNVQLEELMQRNREACKIGITCAMDRIMLLRRHAILDGIPAEDIDSYIADIGKKFMDKYEKHSRADLAIMMLLELMKNNDDEEEGEK